MNGPLADVFRYNRWANLALLDACAALTTEQLDARVPGTTRTIRELLVHLVGGQQNFIQRTQGRQHEGVLSAWPGLAALRDIAASTSEELIRIAEATETSPDVDLPYRGKTYRYPVSFFLTQALAHGAEHRAEITMTLATLGVAHPDLDGWFYAAAMGYGSEVGKVSRPSSATP
ncbi:MAG TPA: DinB family protein [Candidatus Acidoferrales bacterium]|nr:DinB family protein [Candidatus Acidoferrales bacterium]